MSQDEVMDEVRAIREAYAERFGHDLQAIYRDAKDREGREGKDGRKVVALQPKPARHRVISETK